jgi:hypothetical protein
MEEDWDNLIILDACRLDAYRQAVPDYRNVGYKISNATESWDFMSKNFEGERFHDTIYITANPYATRLEQDTFYSIEHLMNTHWNDELETVMPSDVVDVTTQKSKKFPNKRYIVHFMQPHYPFIGSKGKHINHRGYKREQDDNGSIAPNVWWILQYRPDGYKEITQSAVWEAYKENLNTVLSHANKLIEKLPGKTIITADHGTMIGDRIFPFPVRGYGHAHSSFVPPVVRVPWDVHNSDKRRKIKKDPPIENQDFDDEIIKNRLEKLGYRE